VEHVDLRSRFFVILAVTGCLVLAWITNDIKLAQDLEGGTTLRFALDIEGARRAGRVSTEMTSEEVVADTLKIIDQRVNATGLTETVLTPVGDNKFEISLPVGAEGDADRIVEVVTALGKLEFRIEVLPENAYRQPEGDSPPPMRPRIWPGDETSFREFKEKEVARWKEARAAGQPYQSSDPRFLIVRAKEAKDEGIGAFHVLEAGRPIPGNEAIAVFGGEILDSPVVHEDQTGTPVVDFDVKGKFQNDFGKWTGANLGMPMAIVLNEEYYSAPYINDMLTTNVRITLGTGNRQRLREEAETLTTVLKTGSLKVRPSKEAETRLGPALAGKSRERGIQAVLAAFVLVLLFMVVYYRAAGMVANVALLLNVVLLMGFMAFFRAALSLPGIAGIVLTVGMAVDANILINERVREERRRGRTLRRALTEGYARALSAIVDANVTSLITAAFLFKFGSGPVRGFAVTLAIGLLVSMFTAIYVTRTIFEWLVKRGILKEMSLWGSGEPPRVSWVGLRRVFVPLSVAAVVLGLVAFWSTDKYTLYDVEFTGGYKLQASFETPTGVDEVSRMLARERRDVVVRAESFDADNQPATFDLAFDGVGPYPDAQVVAAGEGGRSVEIKVQRLFPDEIASPRILPVSTPDGRTPAGLEGLYLAADENRREQWHAEAFRRYLEQVLGDRLLPEWELEPAQTYEPPPADGADADPELAEFAGGLRMKVAMTDPQRVLEPELLARVIRQAFPFWVEEEGGTKPRVAAEKGLDRKVLVRRAPESPEGVTAYEIYLRSKTAGGQDAEHVASVTGPRLGDFLGGERFHNALERELGEGSAGRIATVAKSDPFPSQDYVGPGYAQRLKNDALLALVLSLFGIIVYVAIRFHSRAMGFAAVLCLFHDVAVTLGLVALCNAMGLVDAKINLTMVAAFLTLVGYSVNDTVVIFDRIRENRGKKPTLDGGMIDAAINQTLARSIKTTVTVLLVCLALFVFNVGQRNVLEGFSFVLILGCFIGTYSTIAISAPLLLYLPSLWERVRSYAPDGRIVSRCLESAGTLLLVPLAALAWLAWAAAFAVATFVMGLVLFVPWSLSPDSARGEVRTSA